jgi:hypothetical protein
LLAVAALGVGWIAGQVYRELFGRETRVSGAMMLLVACSPLMLHSIDVANMTIFIGLLMGIAALQLARRRDVTSAVEDELRRARFIVGVGVALWGTLAAAVMTRFGPIASVVLVGWGGSSVVCLAFVFGPLAATRLRPTADNPASEPLEPATAAIDLRDAIVSPPVADEMVRAAEGPRPSLAPRTPGGIPLAQSRHIPGGASSQEAMVRTARPRRRHRPSREANGADTELHRARIVILGGLALWSVIALAVQLRYGTIATFVVVGWGGSILVCLALTIGPFGLAWRRQLHNASANTEDAVPAGAVVVPHHAVEPTTDVIDLRDLAHHATGVEEQVRELLDQQ